MDANQMTDDILGHTLPPAEVSNHQLFVMLVGMRSQIGEQKNEIVALRATVADQGELLDEMQATWDNAAGVLKFIKIIGAIAGAAGAVLVFWKAIKG